MKKAFWNILFALVALTSFANANAYTMLDTAIVTVVMPAGWKMVAITRKPGYIASTYSQLVGKDKRAESLSEIELKKEMGKDAVVMVNEMSDRIKKQVTVQHCDVQDLKKIPQPDNLFNLWEQRIQCQRSESGIIQWYLNVDPVSLVLFTYTIPVYPFTDKDHDAAIAMLKKAIGICYKDKPCTSIQ